MSHTIWHTLPEIGDCVDANVIQQPGLSGQSRAFEKVAYTHLILV